MNELKLHVCAMNLLSCIYVAAFVALVTHKAGASNDDLYDNLAHEYIRCMSDMNGRGPGKYYLFLKPTTYNSHF